MGNPTNSISSTAEKRRQKLLDVLADLEFLPTSVAVPMQVLKLKQSGTAGMAEIAATLSADAGLATKILSLVNSAAFSPATKVTRLSQAAAMIGMKNLMPLVFGLSLGGMFNKLSLRSEDRAALFQSGLLKACAARSAAAIVAPEQQEEAFLCGLLQDVASAAILASDRASLQDALQVLEIQDAASRKLREEQSYGTTHAAVGALIVARLGLPDLFTQSVGLHHSGVEAMSAALGPGLARALDMAAALPHRLTSGTKAIQSVSLKLKCIVGDVDNGQAEALAKDITDAYSVLYRTFGENDEASGAYRQFLQQISAEVARTTEEAVKASQSVIGTLKVQHTKLAQEVGELKHHVARSELDGLTGIFTRAAFLRRLGLLLQAARDKGIECHIGDADIDNFKRVNDTWGHAFGDEAIREVANRLSTIIKGRGIAARMGGDEFAFAMVRRPGERPLTEETQLLSDRLSSFTLKIGKELVQIGASAGVFSFGIPKPSDTADSVLASADELMYQVKRSGKGRCLTGSAEPTGPSAAA